MARKLEDLKYVFNLTTIILKFLIDTKNNYGKNKNNTIKKIGVTNVMINQCVFV